MTNKIIIGVLIGIVVFTFWFYNRPFTLDAQGNRIYK